MNRLELVSLDDLFGPYVQKIITKRVPKEWKTWTKNAIRIDYEKNWKPILAEGWLARPFCTIREGINILDYRRRANHAYGECATHDVDHWVITNHRIITISRLWFC